MMISKKIMLTALIAASLSMGLAGCGGGKSQDSVKSEEEIKQMVQDFSLDKLTAEGASINSHQLIVKNGNQSDTYDLPKDEFFVSIAPYVNQTHPCEIHSLTGCQGEMSNESFDVTITDQEGKVVLKDTLQSYDNGFIDLWLPRDQIYLIEISHGNRTAKAEISTFKNDQTCITTLQLT